MDDRFAKNILFANVPQVWRNLLDTPLLDTALEALADEKIISPEPANIFQFARYVKPNGIKVIILGQAEKVSTKESLAYFASRPFGSQLGAWVSQQSKVISSRSILEMKLAEMKQKFKDGKVPLPDFWGGYRIIPASFEFWQGRKSRLHDRLLYTQNENGNWEIERMAP